VRRAFRLTRWALRDLDDIADYTLRRWGASQMEAYLRRIDARIACLAENPDLGRRREDVGKGYCCFLEGSHLIFYVLSEDRVVVIGLPHRAMDVGRFFRREG
jgi:toxin ParE1/3/4